MIEFYPFSLYPQIMSSICRNPLNESKSSPEPHLSLLASSMNGLLSSSVRSFHSAPSRLEISELCILREIYRGPEPEVSYVSSCFRSKFGSYISSTLFTGWGRRMSHRKWNNVPNGLRLRGWPDWPIISFPVRHSVSHASTFSLCSSDHTSQPVSEEWSIY